ncbi:MAG: BamA/TamA family outer membrane protein, partial [Kiritimatiellae bacterium]|nr:BamA/TamA family outer membrane protein [Kiritimatiellia bacterium]
MIRKTTIRNLLPAFILFLAGMAWSDGGTFTPLTKPYHVVFEGLSGTDLEPLFKQVSDTWNYRNAPPPTMALLHMRMRRDSSGFKKLLMSRGYFNAEIQSDISGVPDDLTARITVLLNKPFVFGTVQIVFTNTLRGMMPEIPARAVLGLVEGERAYYRTVTIGRSRLLDEVRRQGYPFVKVTSEVVTADYASERVNVRWVLEAGMQAKFGTLDVIGLKRVKRSLIQKMVPWKKGALYNPSDVRIFQDLLASSGLFSVSILSMQSAEETDDTVEMKLEVTERPRHSVGFGVGYNTEKGAGVSANWEDRNLFGEAECLHAEVSVAENQTQGELSYCIPHFFHRSVALKAFSRLGDDRPRAYDSVYWKNQLGMSWDLSPQLNLSCAYALKIASVQQFDETQKYYLQSFPTSVRWDFRNDRIEPTRGGVLFAEGEYFTNWKDQSRFIRERFRWRQIVKLWSIPQITLSGSCGLGLIQGGDVFDIPADERFYAGG